MSNFFKILLQCSEIGANIAKICRSDEHLFSLLIEQKGVRKGKDDNFIDDFKTLADVLIQETFKYYIGSQYPSLKGSIFGEENNLFKNKLDVEIEIKLKDDVNETIKLLTTILNGDEIAAKTLADQIYKMPNLNEIPCCDLVNLPKDEWFDFDQLGIWIDPIDSTQEYINGDVSNEFPIHLNGLQCCTILIGIFNKTTGQSIGGVVNQPFHKLVGQNWIGDCNWGVCQNSEKLTSIVDTSETNLEEKPKLVLSVFENETIKSKLKQHFDIYEVSGAGYKSLTVFKGYSDAYILSRTSISKWDICGPHAILKSIGGDAIVYDSYINSNVFDEIKYFESIDSKSINSHKINGGVIAYKNVNILDKILSSLNV